MRRFEKAILFFSFLGIVGATSALVYRGEIVGSIKGAGVFGQGSRVMDVWTFEHFKKPNPSAIVQTGVYNSFTEEHGLFSFSYKNNYEVKENKDVYYLRELATQTDVFQIFEKKNDLSFNPALFECLEKSGKTICYSNITPSTIVKDIIVMPDLFEDAQRFLIFTRAEAIKRVVRDRFKNEDFSKYNVNCFKDVPVSDPNNGYICFAKSRGYISGIQGEFRPNNTIDLWGMLKFLFLAYDVKDYSVKDEFVDAELFELMTSNHLAYPLIKKAYYEGIFDDVKDGDIWPNRIVYMDEAEKIIKNFKDWRGGKVIKNYQAIDGYQVNSAVYLRDLNRNFVFDEMPPDVLDESHRREVYLVQNAQGVDIYAKIGGKVREYIYTLSGKKVTDIKDIFLEYRKQKLIIRMAINFKDGVAKYYALNIDKYEFSYLRSKTSFTIGDQNLLPNVVSDVPSGIPVIRLYLDGGDFENLIMDKTFNTRYPAFMEMRYPDGVVVSRSVTVKTRGNANRAYIKSSYTIESFDPFTEYAGVSGDEFLAGSNEIKLRSLVFGTSLIAEKLFYRAFESMGYPEPNFFEALLQVDGVNMGLYQVTESVKDDFFTRRGIDAQSYFYAKGTASDCLANLTYCQDDGRTASLYEMKNSSDDKRLVSFINALTNNDLSIWESIDVPNVFDFAYMIYATDARDSTFHNYYLYYDGAIKKWRIFFWDGDATFENVPAVSKNGLKAFGFRNNGAFNNLIYYVFRNLNNSDFDKFYKSFGERWNSNVDLVSMIDWYVDNLGEAFKFDNALWNGKFIQDQVREKDTLDAISGLKRRMARIEKLP